MSTLYYYLKIHSRITKEQILSFNPKYVRSRKWLESTCEQTCTTNI